MTGAGDGHSETAAVQIPLPFPARQRYDRASFQVSDSNRAALSLVERWPQWPGPACAIFAPEGSGKTHLAHIWAKLSGARLYSGGVLTEAEVFALDGVFRIAIDDADLSAATEDGARAMFFALNRAHQEGGYVLLTGQSAPAAWRTGLPDLRTRLSAVSAIEIQTPDDALMAAALTKSFADRQLQPAPALIGFAVARMERNFAAAERLAEAMDRATLGTGKTLSLELADRLIAAQAHD
jgi:chromosomal replication initiation ATPase DnaA